VSRAARSQSWGAPERSDDLRAAEREPLDLLVIGGGITGAGVLRDAASRGLRALLVERDDFAAGTSGRSSKLVHGGLRYIAEGQLRVTREACRERDLLVRLNPNLIRPQPFLFPAYAGGSVPLWQVRAALAIYAGLANLRRSARFRMLSPRDACAWSRDLRSDGLLGAGLYWDARVDDARLVLETLRDARAMGAGAVPRAEVVSLLSDGRRVIGARVRDRDSGRALDLRAEVVVNASGPSVERVRGLSGPRERGELRPAKGVHLVIPRGRLRLDAAVGFEARDGRRVFASPWDDTVLVGTTDAFTDEIDEPVVRIQEVHYLLDAANDFFPDAGLTTNDLCSVFAGVRPLAAGPDETAPPSSVSREDRVECDVSGLISVFGGKLTTHRAVGERIGDRVVRCLSAERRRALQPSATRRLPLRRDDFDADALGHALRERFGVGALQSDHLVCHYGADAETLLEQAPPEWRRPIGSSRFSYAEIAWCWQTECAASLCDLLERRMRMALFAPGQGLPELSRIAEVAARVAGWDAERRRAEARAYVASVQRRYQIQPAAAGGAGAERSAA
jgi:glycerol-3-phosphate dehydrogenase